MPLWEHYGEYFLEEVEFARANNSQGAVCHGEPGENMFDMAFGCVETDDQALGDLLVGKALGQQREHFSLASTQGIKLCLEDRCLS